LVYLVYKPHGIHSYCRSNVVGRGLELLPPVYQGWISLGSILEPREQMMRCLEYKFVVHKSIEMSVAHLDAKQAILDMAKMRDQGSFMLEF